MDARSNVDASTYLYAGAHPHTHPDAPAHPDAHSASHVDAHTYADAHAGAGSTDGDAYTHTYIDAGAADAHARPPTDWVNKLVARRRQRQ